MSLSSPPPFKLPAILFSIELSYSNPIANSLPIYDETASPCRKPIKAARSATKAQDGQGGEPFKRVAAKGLG